jgi:renal tumor antigen
MHKYKLLGRKGEGTFSEVVKAQSIKTGQFMAIKMMRHSYESIEQVHALREIQALKRLSPHANIVTLHEVMYDQPTGRLALVFELMDMNIYELIKGRTEYLGEDRVKNYMYQLLKAVDHMHKNGIFHRCGGVGVVVRPQVHAPRGGCMQAGAHASPPPPHPVD